MIFYCKFFVFCIWENTDLVISDKQGTWLTILQKCKNKKKLLGCVVITDSEPVAITWRAVAKIVSQVKTQEKWPDCDHRINLYSTSGIFQHTHIHAQHNSADPRNSNRQKTKPVILQSAEKKMLILSFLQHLLLLYIWIYAKLSHVCWNTW